MVQDGLSGFVVPAADSLALSEAIKKLAIDSSLAKTMGTHAERFVRETLHYTKTAETMQQVFLSALGD